jgi:hypothetical protein
MRARNGAPFWHARARPDPALAKRRRRTPRTLAWSCLGHGVALQSWCSGFPVSSSPKPGSPPEPLQIRGNPYKTEQSGVWLEEDPPSPAIAPCRSPPSRSRIRLRCNLEIVNLVESPPARRESRQPCSQALVRRVDPFGLASQCVPIMPVLAQGIRKDLGLTLSQDEGHREPAPAWPPSYEFTKIKTKMDPWYHSTEKKTYGSQRSVIDAFLHKVS